MSEIIVAYWSGTGNTQMMAKSIVKGIQDAGKEAKALPMEAVSASELKDCPVFALGCPAMGAEELEEGTVEPFVTEVEGFATGKKIALFGSYDWGDGEWMRTWQERMENAGARIIDREGLICHGTPDAEGEAECEALGKAIAQET